jgi:aspartate 1-decarboxylase
MFVKALKGKIHRATVTATRVEYPGSLGVDSRLLEAAGILPYEEVLVANVSTGSRAETYVIPAEAGSGKIEVLGAAARLFSDGDIVIIMNFGYYSPQELKDIKPRVVLVDDKNLFQRML